MSQIINITSEALQATIRRLLPSQQGFGEDLQASNVITPIIDLTPTAEGSSIPEDLQQAYAYGSQTSFVRAGSGTTTIVNTAGFYKVTASCTIEAGAATRLTGFELTRPLVSNKVVWQMTSNAGSTGNLFESVTFIVFLQAGDGFDAVATAGGAIYGSSRQIADVNGVLVNPSGFTPQ